LGETIEGIYASESKYEEYNNEKLIKFIEEKINSTGYFLCIKIKGKRLKCEELDCNVSIPFLGSIPTKFSLQALVNQLLGRGKIFEYKLIIKREDKGVLVLRK
ncbi:MAG: hypothetical protein QXD89_00930, partial [Candidatus Aenigmatarchaeota archaeon]